MKVEILPQSGSRNADASPAISLPPDKSIFHRILIIGALTTSHITIPISSIEDIPADVYATILALEALGVDIDISRNKLEFQGVGIGHFTQPHHKINCANSGTTARLLMGLLAGENLRAVLTGDASLSGRPMGRVAAILKEFGANIESSESGTMPVTINGTKLHSALVHTELSSAQIKSAAILAALHTGGAEIHEKTRSRNHTELMLEAFGSGIHSSGKATSILNYTFTTPESFTYTVPGDPSSAAYMIAAAMLLRKNIILKNMSVNSTRINYFRRLRESGVVFTRKKQKEEWKEKRADIMVDISAMKTIEPFRFLEEQTPGVIDEIPFLAVLAAFSPGDSIFYGAGELRKKESDRLAAIVENLSNFGVNAEARDDHLVVFKTQHDPAIPGGTIRHHGDHRIAMAMAVFALKAKEPVIIPDAEVVSVSYPNFYHDLALIAGKERIKIF